MPSNLGLKPPPPKSQSVLAPTAYSKICLPERIYWNDLNILNKKIILVKKDKWNKSRRKSENE